MRTISTPGMGLADFGLLTEPNTRAPRSASNCAISRPMPEETPVINAVLFFSVVCNNYEPRCVYAHYAKEQNRVDHGSFLRHRSGNRTITRGARSAGVRLGAQSKGSQPDSRR